MSKTGNITHSFITPLIRFSVRAAHILTISALPFWGLQSATLQTANAGQKGPAKSLTRTTRQLSRASKQVAQRGGNALAIHVLSVHSQIPQAQLAGINLNVNQLAAAAMTARASGLPLSTVIGQMESGASTGQIIADTTPNTVHAQMLLTSALAAMNANGRAASRGLVDTDDDGTPNALDDDADDDGTPNGSDDDVDGDGTPNSSDDDVDGDGMHNGEDDDVDGDGVANDDDGDIDGDGDDNSMDADDDGDGMDDDADDDADGDGNDDANDDDVNDDHGNDDDPNDDHGNDDDPNDDHGGDDDDDSNDDHGDDGGL